MRTVRLYFDCISPYAWLALNRLEEWEKDFGATVECVPVLFGALLDANGSLGPAEVPAKRTYVYTDVFRLAALWGLDVKGPPEHPFNPLKALRLVTAATDPATKRRLALAVCNAAWRDGLDLTDDRVLERLVNECGLDADTLLPLVSAEATKRRLIEQTQEAIDACVFGVPTFRYGDDLFWGVDRMAILGLAVQGQLDIDRPHLEEVLARPRGIDRKRAPRP